MADGLLVIDKPSGPTSHDVVARMRRVLGERRIGHTGTLDPMATGVLPLVIGKATRLAQFLSAADKSYEAVVRLGIATTTADAEGEPIGVRFEAPLPARDAIERALDAFRGTFLQQPPAFSAKKIGGKRSYAIARARDGRDGGDGQERNSELGIKNSERVAGSEDAARSEFRIPNSEFRRPPLLPAAARVTVSRLDILAIDADTVTLSLDCSAGFYIRSLAHDLGVALGTGAHLAALRRTRSGRFTEADAVPLAVVEQDRDRGVSRIVPLSRMLPELPCAVLTDEGVRRAIQGADIRPSDREVTAADDAWFRNGVRVRLLNSSGELIGIAEPARSERHLHASVVLV